MKKTLRSYLSVVLIAVLIATSGCSSANDAGSSTKDVGFDELGTLITNQVRDDLLDTGSLSEADLQDGAVPMLETTRVHADNFMPPVELDLERVEDGVWIQNMMIVNATVIFVLKAKSPDDLQYLEDYANEVYEQQLDLWTGYPVNNQLEKAQANILHTEGDYVIYVTDDLPQNKLNVILDAILN